MAEHIGLVIDTESGNYAQVLTDRKGACGGCRSTSGGCRSCLAGGAKMESRVANPVGAGPGDLVKLHQSSGNLFTGAAILYLLPVLGVLIGAFVGAGAATALGLSEVSASVAGAAAGLAIGFAGVIGLDRSSGLRRRITPTITAVITPAADKPYAPDSSCCS